MGLETGSYISALVSTNPVGATDPKSQGDDHIRFLKAKILETFPNVNGAVNGTPAELNLVVGATGGLATLSVSFAAVVASLSAITTLVNAMGTLSSSVTSSDITGSIRTPVLQTQAGYTAGTFTAATVVVNNKGVITGISSGSISSGWTLISTGTASNSATIDITGLTSTYEAYAIVITDMIPATDTTGLQMRTSTDGGSTFDSGASDYRWVCFPGHEAGSNRTGSAAADAISICGSDTGYYIGNAVGESFNATVILSNPLGTTVYKKIRWQADFMNPSAQMASSHGSGCRAATADVDAVRFLMSSGNITSGKFRLYGIQAT